MATRRFKENFNSLLKIIGTDPEILCDFLCEKKAFSEEFMLMLIESESLNKLDENSDYNYTIEDVRQKLKDYDVTYNKKRKKYVVDITKNNVFSYNDSEQDLIKKMKYYLEIEDYERASVLNNYLQKLEISY